MPEHIIDFIIRLGEGVVTKVLVDLIYKEIQQGGKYSIKISDKILRTKEELETFFNSIIKPL